mmetsp:Transcript_34431/g.81171  ORF Transcript_34431/g.81171 Transcript_34431/m.81171 type:complete len:99 (-) Transcript_34431:1530-1826(-)
MEINCYERIRIERKISTTTATATTTTMGLCDGFSPICPDQTDLKMIQSKWTEEEVFPWTAGAHSACSVGWDCIAVQGQYLSKHHSGHVSTYFDESGRK